MSSLSDTPRLSVVDRRFLRRSFILAEKALRAASPNPRVGCVLVQNGKVIAESWHRASGQAHAEVVALSQAGDDADGATAYVSLEPCCHHGRTPPCTNALLEYGVARVVFGVRDSNPLVNGRGEQQLRDSRVEVDCADWALEHLLLNPGYECSFRLGRPWLRLKLAVSLDGFMALEDGSSQWISCPASRADNQRLRARSDAVLSTGRTTMADDARFDVREKHLESFQPLRVILDRSLRCQPKAAIFNTDLNTIQLLCRHTPTSADRIARLWQPQTEEGMRLFELSDPQDSPLHFYQMAMERLHEQSIREIHVEAGAQFSRFLLENELVDELVLYQAPKLFGRGLRYFERAAPSLDQCAQWHLMSSRRTGDDLRLQYLHPRWLKE
ncbi:MAG: bifunctional diaminohydroxyphosphoribosylaminopyrimidine deaminase/5-amino-6-(5-phosphoribosylamino)uracil reductase RibD [Proteobacteria bacterium]|nr:bifunctional diaminohydroxyphosphoribosylaminopyrimidine deaminase/5-amino-6-(5-phosphoribosylamino)uracil reductase RibD [Pseudomonadota bacterium]